jgi:alkanesulfonate monooxygenase SsuD/methylene tetrahydromethanopterin reductase-like flavin-dependent oxidoreductase (luciferase family)
MRFGVWFDFRNPPAWRRPYADLYAETLDQIAWAESAGFESVLLSEHHVTDDGYLPSLFPALAAIAVRTSTIRIGTAVLLAPFHHPVRVAEDAAFVDQLSGGRLELGLGLAYREAEFAALGVPRRERATRTEELIEIVRRAWSGEPFSYTGRHWQLDDVVVTPTPAQPGGPPLWLGGTSVAAAGRAGRLACHWVPDVTVPLERYAVYRAALEAAGHDPAAFRTATNPTILVSDDPERAWDEAKEHLLYQYNQYRRWQGGEVVANADDLPRDAYVVGTPDEVAAAVAQLLERHRPDRLFFWARPPGLSLETSNRSLRLFAEEVIPRFANVRA